LPTSYVSEPTSDQPSSGAAIESITDGESPSRPSAEALPLSEPREAMPLKPPASPEAEGGRRRVGGLPSVVSIVGGLAVVLGIFFVVAWGMRRAAPGALATLPKQVVEVLGRATLTGRQQVHLVRCGNKLVLVSVTPEAVETLTEITDPLEVDRLAGLCEQANPNSSSAAFRRVLQQFAHEGKGTYAT
jgi:flagellar biogenesis protein FliO